MSEPKLCPYRKVDRTHYVPTILLKDESLNPAWCEVGEFLPCLQDECAMWRKRTEANPDCHDDVATLNEPKMIVGGYCGLAGNP